MTWNPALEPADNRDLRATGPPPGQHRPQALPGLRKRLTARTPLTMLGTFGTLDTLGTRDMPTPGDALDEPGDLTSQHGALDKEGDDGAHRATLPSPPSLPLCLRPAILRLGISAHFPLATGR